MSRLWRWMGGRQAAGVALALRVTFQGGSAMYETERSAREGQTGPSLQGLTIAVPGTAPVGPHYFYFRQVDQYGRTVGYSTASLYAALAGYTGHAVDMAAGVNDDEAVADAFRAVAATVYSSATRVGAVVTISDPNIDATLAFLPSSSSGGGALMGTRDITSSSFFNNVDSNVCSLVTPAFSAATYLYAVQVFVGATYVDPLRLVLYTGGGINAPAGTPLLWDSGLWPGGVTTNGYLTLYPAGLVPIPASTRLQVLLMGSAGTTTSIGYQSAGSAGDWAVSPGGLWQVTGTSIGANPAVAPPAVFPAGGTNASSTFTFNVRLMYRTAPLFGDGQLLTSYGVHVPASSLGFTTSFSANVLQGGGLPPQLEGMGLDYVEIAATGSASFRLGAFQGGGLEAAGGSSLVYDLGRGPAGPGLPTGWYRLSVPAHVHAPIDRTQRIWSAARDNASGTVRFSNVPGPGTAGPDTDPMDYPQNTAGQQPEYESFSSNPAFSIDPDVPFEAAFAANTTNAPVDALPGNVQGSALGFRIRPVLLQAV